ncbi:MAG TPA: hypothetical protein ENJ50_11420 [Planctomycetaceae bacterium]|nr:hypothetical protein [Planctomycetaceae bacterium]
MSSTPSPGVYYDVPFEDYKEWDAMNHSTLKHGLRSMAHLKACLDDPPEPSKAMRLGSLVHAAALEPLEMLNRYIALPPFENDIRRPDGTEYANVKATKAYKDSVADFMDEHPDKTVITQEEFDVLKGVCAALQANKRCRDWLFAGGQTELSMVWEDPDTGVLCKGRIDKLLPGLIVDIKTTSDAMRFESQIAKLAYHQQMAFYRDGLMLASGEECQAAIVAIESAAPFGIRAAIVADDAINWGRESYRRLLREYAACRAANEWPNYESPDYWHLPSWATADAINDEIVELVIGGQAVGVK